MPNTYDLPARREGLLSRDLGDEIVVVDERSQQAHSLSGATAQVWRATDGSTLEGLSQDVIDAATAELLGLDLLEVPSGLNRRSFLVRGGTVVALTGAATVALPMVAAHASTLPVTAFSATTAGAHSATITPTVAGGTVTGSLTLIGGGGGTGVAAGAAGASVTAMFSFSGTTTLDIKLGGAGGNGTLTAVGSGGASGGMRAGAGGAGGAGLGTVFSGGGGGGGSVLNNSTLGHNIFVVGGGGGGGTTAAGTAYPTAATIGAAGVNGTAGTGASAGGGGGNSGTGGTSTGSPGTNGQSFNSAPTEVSSVGAFAGGGNAAAAGKFSITITSGGSVSGS